MLFKDRFPKLYALDEQRRSRDSGDELVVNKKDLGWRDRVGKIVSRGVDVESGEVNAEGKGVVSSGVAPQPPKTTIRESRLEQESISEESEDSKQKHALFGSDVSLDDAVEADTHKKKVRKISIHIKLDQDVIEFFKKDGAGYQTRINKTLREYCFRENIDKNS